MGVPSSSPEIPAGLAALIERLIGGEAAALARALSLIEEGGARADALAGAAHRAAGRAVVVGFSGPPGAGKSTLIDAYIAELRRQGRSVAVAAVDPSSPYSGGAVLGDRIRMQRHTEDPGVFIRSLSSRGHVGGLRENIHRVVDAMDAAGRDVVVIETVGAGQSEVEIVEVADVCVIVGAPGLGDDVQAMKAGILEIADVLAVNKADLMGAGLTADHLRAMLALRADRREVPVIDTVATTGAGVEALAAAIDARAARSPAAKRAHRLRRLRRLVAEAAGRRVRDRILASDDPGSERLMQAVADGAMRGGGGGGADAQRDGRLLGARIADSAREPPHDASHGPPPRLRQGG